jgi:hypothetical protein
VSAPVWVFSRIFTNGVVFVSTGIGDVSAGFDHARTRLVPLAFGAPQEV